METVAEVVGAGLEIGEWVFLEGVLIHDAGTDEVELVSEGDLLRVSHAAETL